MTTTRLLVIWLLLLLATFLTWWLGESPSSQLSAAWLAAVVLALAVFKGVLIALDYMELRHAPALWQRIVVGWLVLVCLLLWGLSAVQVDTPSSSLDLQQMNIV